MNKIKSADDRRFQAYPEYRDSGVEWLGEIPAHWTIRRLKTIASVQLSNVDKKTIDGQQEVRLCNYVDVYYNERITNDLEFMTASATADQVHRFGLKAGDVLITKDSETPDDIAVPAVVAEDLPDVICGYHLAHVRPEKSSVDGRFLARAFSGVGPRDQFHAAANGITRFGLTGDAIQASEFAIPPIDEQRYIADFLDRETAKSDALIARKERLIELLQEKRAALIARTILRGLDTTVPMKDSGIEWLGQIPKHWQSEKAKTLFKEFDSRSVSGDEELMTVSHITGVTRRSEKNVTMFEAESMEGYKLCQSGDLVINTLWAWMGALGVAWETGIVSPAYNVYRQRGNTYLPKYLDLLSRVPPLLTELRRFSKGVWTSRLRLYPEELFQIHLPVPPIAEQEQILKGVEKTLQNGDALIKKVQEGIDRLKEYRTALISAAVTGKIDVRDQVAA